MYLKCIVVLVKFAFTQITTTNTKTGHFSCKISFTYPLFLANRFIYSAHLIAAKLPIRDIIQHVVLLLCSEMDLCVGVGLLGLHNKNQMFFPHNCTSEKLYKYSHLL